MSKSQPALRRIIIAKSSWKRHKQEIELKNIQFESVLMQKRSYPLVKMTSEGKWKIEKSRIMNLPIEMKRKLYKCPDFVTLDQIEPWSVYGKTVKDKAPTPEDLKEYKKHNFKASKDSKLAEKVSIFKGDITKLEIDAIVNAANSALKRGGGVDGAIHRAAGHLLQAECDSLRGCNTGDAKITGGYDLPAKYVIHTVGPQDGSPSALKSCYEKSLEYHQHNKINTFAFPCISTGIYGFPNRPAAHIALATARYFLEKNEDLQRIIFCTFLPVDVNIYETLMKLYFPLDGSEA